MFFLNKEHVLEGKKIVFAQVNSSAEDNLSNDISNFLPTHVFFNSTGWTPEAAHLGFDGEFGADCPNAILVILYQAQELRMDIRLPTTTDLLPQQDTSSSIALGETRVQKEETFN